MLRHLVLSLVLGTSLSLAGGGCRSCSSCHDYDGPVADCGNCGCGRTGSASNCGACSPCDNGCPCNCDGGACSSGGCSTGGCSTGGCNCGIQGAPSTGEYYEEAPEMTDSEVSYE
jgi:hypothetical protein